HFTARQTARLFRLHKPIGVIPNCVNTSQFSPASPDEVEPATIVYVGTLARKKGVLDLCRAFSILVESLFDARLRLVGRDAADKSTGVSSMWELCKRNLSPIALARTEYTGPRPHEEVQEHVRRATACVFPSYAEALPLSWLEAMACAKPIIAYDIGWAPEIVEH